MAPAAGVALGSDGLPVDVIVVEPGFKWDAFLAANPDIEYVLIDDSADGGDDGATFDGKADVENIKAVYHSIGYKDAVVKDPVLDTAISFVVPYAAYIAVLPACDAAHPTCIADGESVGAGEAHAVRRDPRPADRDDQVGGHRGGRLEPATLDDQRL